MKTYIKNNKEAWEEAYDHRQEDYDQQLIETLKTQALPYFTNPMVKVLEKYDFKDRTVAQFCCNNGRELLSLSKLGIKKGYGFDIAENMIQTANQTAQHLNYPVEFICTNVLEIDETYDNSFDFILITVGALCWFEDLNVFFKVVSKCLKKEGQLLIEEGHPFYNVLATDDEENYNKAYPNLPVNNYFKHEPWVSNEGMGYMSGAYESKTFTSYSHTFSHIINALIKNDMAIDEIIEYDVCIANLFDALNHQGLPLSYHLMSHKK